MKKIKIGQIGIGHNHAQGKMLALRKLPDIFEIVGVAESDPVWREKRGKLPCYDGIPRLTEEELLATPGLEAVAVETDGFELVPTALRCARRGLHIHLDKPGGEDIGAFGELLDFCRSKQLAIQLAYVYRYNPGLRFCINAVKSGWLGQIFEVHAVMSRYDGDSSDYRKWLAGFKGGAMYIFAGYLVDIAVQLLGAPNRVTPFLKQTRHDGLIDNGLAVLEYDIATATLRVSVEEIDGMRHRRLIVCGTGGTVELCPIEVPAAEYDTSPLKVRLTLKHDVPGFNAGTTLVDCGCIGDRYAGQLREFADIVRNGSVNPFGYDHEYTVQKVLLAASGVIDWTK